MNLMQIHDDLKTDPLQSVMAAANGQNPIVPPYMALAELNRRKQLGQPRAQAPQGSVKDQIEQSLMQPQNLPGLAAQGVPVPQAPQPQGIPAQMPRQMAGAAPQQPPTRMAAGGLASVPMRRDMFNYAPGGIIAFDDGGSVVEERGQKILEGIRDGVGETSAAAEKPASIEEMANRILMNQMAGKTNVEAPEDPEIARARLFEKYPILRTLPGAQAEKLATSLEAKDKAQTEKFKEAQGRMGLAALSNALIGGGEATRGQKGMGNQIASAFGGFGRVYNAENAAAEEREAKQEGLERGRMVDVSKIRSDIEAMQRAFAENRVGEAMKYKEALNKQVAEVEKLQGTAAAAALKNQIDLAQLANQRAQTANQKSYYDSLRDSKPTAEEKTLLGVLAKINNDDLIGKLSARAAEAGLNTEEGRRLLDEIYEAKKVYFQDAKLPVPSKIQLPELEKKLEEPNAGLEFIKATFGDVKNLFRSTPKEVTSRPPEVQKALDKYK
jgi:hypothetical protein